jgi:M6 family metalloprotease-like protein
MSGNRFINEVMTAADNDVDFSKYDFVNIVTPSGFEYDSGAYGMQGTYDGKYFNSALLGTAAMGIDNGRGLEPWLIHETGHILGMIHATNDWSPYIWDVSANAVSTAPNLYAWNKFVLGWIENSQIDCIGSSDKVKTTHLLSPLGDISKETKAVVIKINSHYAIVIENRTKNKIDKNLAPSEEGVLVYTVDINKTGGPNNQCISLVYSTDASNSGTIQVGESLVAEGYKIDVLQKQKLGYVISITKQ